MKRVTLIALCAVALFVLPATAAKPQPTLVLNPSPVISYNIYTATGCGYPRSTTFRLEFERSTANYALYYGAFSDASGCLHWNIGDGTIFFQAEAPGTTQEITIYQNRKVLAHAVQQTIPDPIIYP